MKRVNTRGIVLTRINYGEADRIICFLTPDNGKVKIIAKGVRKQKSKLAGGIELFSVSEISFIIGRSEINTLISSRLVKHYGNIVKDLSRTNLAYELIKRLNKATEDSPDEGYFNLLEQAFIALDDNNIDTDLIEVWFNAQLLRMAGHSPNLLSQKSGEKLRFGAAYQFNLDVMAFQLDSKAEFHTDQIKFLRLLFSPNRPQVLQKVQKSEDLATQVSTVVRSMLQTHIRV